MKILQVNNFYKEGSTGKIVYDIKQILDEKGVENLVCYGRGDDYNERFVIRLCSNFYAKCNKLLCSFFGLKFDWCFGSTSKLIAVIKREKPDVVHLHCINDNIVNIYRIINYLKKKNIRTVLTLHAEFMYTANCGYALECDKWMDGCGKCPRLRQETFSIFFDRTHSSWKKMKAAFAGFEDNLQIVSVSPWLQQRARRSPILSGHCHDTILNGIDTVNTFRIVESNFKEKYGLVGKKVVLHVTASFTRPIKGGKYFVELAKRMPDTTFVLVGNDTDTELPSNIIDMGRISDQRELAKLYSMADLFVLTSEKETFGMTVAESLCCGTPVVGFMSGAPEQIALKAYSSFVPFADVARLEKEVRFWLTKKMNAEQISKEARQKYSKEKMAEAYLIKYYCKEEEKCDTE